MERGAGNLEVVVAHTKGFDFGFAALLAVFEAEVSDDISLELAVEVGDLIIQSIDTNICQVGLDKGQVSFMPFGLVGHVEDLALGDEADGNVLLADVGNSLTHFRITQDQSAEVVGV